jgi:cell fate (sporulation/competence/biofilm development) regulator YlbF (YheA/YmcA/DUF963 family)
MSIYDQARALGKEMLECEQAKKLYAAREAFDNSKDAQKLVEDYTVLKQKWTQVMNDKESDKMQLTDMGKEITDMEKNIKEHPVTSELMKCETEYGAFVNSIFNLISVTIQGEDANTDSCAGCCSSCSGCH